jgi:hypothetical protein
MTDMILAIRQDFTVLPSWTGECRPSQLKTIRTAAIHSGQAAACPWSRSNERAGPGAGSTVFATVIGAVVLRQFPTFTDAAGIALVVLGVALHQASKEPSKEH